MRYKPNMVAGQMRSTFNYWHLGRTFTASPLLNSSFVAFDGTSATYKRILRHLRCLVFCVSFGNKIRALRPMPYEADPGLIDHS